MSPGYEFYTHTHTLVFGWVVAFWDLVPCSSLIWFCIRRALRRLAEFGGRGRLAVGALAGSTCWRLAGMPGLLVLLEFSTMCGALFLKTALTPWTSTEYRSFFFPRCMARETSRHARPSSRRARFDLMPADPPLRLAVASLPGILSFLVPQTLCCGLFRMKGAGRSVSG